MARLPSKMQIFVLILLPLFGMMGFFINTGKLRRSFNSISLRYSRDGMKTSLATSNTAGPPVLLNQSLGPAASSAAAAAAAASLAVPPVLVKLASVHTTIAKVDTTSVKPAAVLPPPPPAPPAPPTPRAPVISHHAPSAGALAGEKRGEVLIFTMDSLQQREDDSKKGGAIGERHMRRALEQALEKLGFKVTTCVSDAEFDREVVKPSYTHFVTDPWTWAGRGWRPKGRLAERGVGQHTFLLDFFGRTEAALKAVGKIDGFQADANILSALPKRADYLAGAHPALRAQLSARIGGAECCRATERRASVWRSAARRSLSHPLRPVRVRGMPGGGQIAASSAGPSTR